MNLDLPIIISPSRSETSVGCLRKGMLADNLCQHPRGQTSDAKAFGSVLHEGAGVWWITGDEEQALAAVDASYHEHEDQLPGPKGVHNLDLASYMMRVYVNEAKLAGEHWAWAAEGWRPYLVEKRVTLDLGLEARLTFKMDRIAVNETLDPPAYVLVDLKSSSKWWWGKRFRQPWPRSLQQMLYQWATANELGITLDGHFIEGMKKDMPTLFEYIELPMWSEEQLNEALGLVVRVAQREAEIIERLRADDGTLDVDVLSDFVLTQTDYDPGHCYDYGGCPYLPLCEAEPGDRLGLLLDSYEWVEPSYLE